MPIIDTFITAIMKARRTLAQAWPVILFCRSVT